MLVLVCGVAASAHAEDLTPTDVARWEDFPGPNVAPPVREGEAFVTSPIQSGRWNTTTLSFTLAPIVAAKQDALVVQGPFHRFEVPGAFVAPALEPTALAKGRYVLFQEAPTLTRTVHVGRVKTVAKDGTVSIDVVYIDELETVSVPRGRVRPLDGTLSWGQPVSFTIDGQRALAWYVGPGRDASHVWALNTGRRYELEGVTPLAIKAFSRGAKVQAVFETTSVLKEGQSQPARQYLKPAVVLEARDRGLTYKVKSTSGEVADLPVDKVFAR